VRGIGGNPKYLFAVGAHCCAFGSCYSHCVWAGEEENGRGVFVGEEELSGLKLDPLDFEVQLAKIRSSLAIRWMSQHPLDVIRLVFLHVYKEVKPPISADWPDGNVASEWLLFLGALGAFVFRKSPGVGIIVLFVALNILSIALTWSVRGRYMVPVQPLIVALVGAMVSRQLTASLQQNSGSKT
jgi:hypothetical protein